MDIKKSRIQIAEDTLTVLKRGYYLNSVGELIELKKTQTYTESNTRVWNPSETDDLITNRKHATNITKSAVEVTNESTLESLIRMIDIGYKKVCILNFASARNAGGGFLNGSQAQEESIARSSGLYPCQLKADEFYKMNRRIDSCFYTDYMIYSPLVPFIKDDSGKLLPNVYTVSVITAPAVNKGVVKVRESHRINEIETVMKRRIRKVLAIAEKEEQDCIILGAWGCGVFQNDPKDISGYFKDVIEREFKSSFEKIVFAIYSKESKFIDPFINDFIQRLSPYCFKSHTILSYDMV